jgi:hypothetical protein
MGRASRGAKGQLVHYMYMMTRMNLDNMDIYTMCVRALAYVARISSPSSMCCVHACSHFYAPRAGRRFTPPPPPPLVDLQGDGCVIASLLARHFALPSVASSTREERYRPRLPGCCLGGRRKTHLLLISLDICGSFNEESGLHSHTIHPFNHTDAHGRTHAHTHAHTRAHTHTHAHKNTHAHSHTPHKHNHTHTHAQTNTHMFTYMHTQTRTHAYTRTHACTQTHTYHTPTNTRIHTRAHTYTHHPPHHPPCHPPTHPSTHPSTQ